jgi:argonaute-like protein implicated in RNA metabolism and viral defense
VDICYVIDIKHRFSGVYLTIYGGVARLYYALTSKNSMNVTGLFIYLPLMVHYSLPHSKIWMQYWSIKC